MIKAVLFDVDGVLLDSFEANFAYYSELLQRVGYPPPTKEEFTLAMHFTLKDTIQALTHSSSDGEIKRIADIGKDSFEEFYQFDLLTMPQSAEKTIEELHKTYQLGIVTSRFKRAIYTMPQLVKLKQCFQVAVGFEDTTNHKPDPEPLLFACEKLQITPEETVYVGDAQSDMLAGKAAGMKVILFAKKNFVNADAYTISFKDLPKIISSL